MIDQEDWLRLKLLASSRRSSHSGLQVDPVDEKRYDYAFGYEDGKPEGWGRKDK